MALQLALVRQADTDWDRRERVHGQIALPPLEEELLRIRSHGADLAPMEPMALYCPERNPGLASGRTLAETLKLEAMPRAALCPLDMGAWEGLSWLDVKSRYGRMYRRWRATPQTVAPPMGETLREAAARAEPLVKEILAEQKSAVIVASRETLLALLLFALPETGRRPDQSVWDLFPADGDCLEHEVVTADDE